MSDSWSVFVIGLTVVNIIAAIWLLQVFSKRKSAADPDTTGHVWDRDLREYNNPLPRWWLWLFWLTVLFSLAYLLIYPGLGKLAGTQGWSQTGQYDEEMQAAEERYGALFARFATVPLPTLASDPAALSAGRNIYLNNCAGCHGADARGAVGYPNLTDAAWLYGGSPEAVLQTITNGRIGVMPALGAAIGEQGVDEVVAYVLSLSGQAAADAALVGAGEQKFAQFCSSCHGAGGVGNPLLGAPSLADDAWLHGGSEAQIRDVILRGRVNQMPAQSAVLSENRIRAVAAYVLSLSR